MTLTETSWLNSLFTKTPPHEGIFSVFLATSPLPPAIRPVLRSLPRPHGPQPILTAKCPTLFSLSLHPNRLAPLEPVKSSREGSENVQQSEGLIKMNDGTVASSF